MYLVHLQAQTWFVIMLLSLHSHFLFWSLESTVVMTSTEEWTWYRSKHGRGSYGPHCSGKGLIRWWGQCFSKI